MVAMWGEQGQLRLAGVTVIQRTSQGGAATGQLVEAGLSLLEKMSVTHHA